MQMKSVVFACLLFCMITIEYATAQWEISGGVSTTNKGDVKAEVKVTFKWGGKKTRRSVKEQVFDVMMYMTNKNTGSSFRLNPCDFALYDQDSDLKVTMKDFDILFADSEHHLSVERLFHELDKDNDQKISLSEFEEKRPRVYSKKSC